jgi:uncharacterized membrane-anchored protein YitT (DUF2179 family)
VIWSAVRFWRLPTPLSSPRATSFPAAWFPLASSLNYYAQGPAWLFGLADINDVVVTAVQVILWIIGWFTLGKKFSLNTLVASIGLPVVLRLAFPFQHRWGFRPRCPLPRRRRAGNAELMLAGIFGGALAGAGVAISYLGNGSTGGFDIVSFIIAKYSEMKQDVSGFIIDASFIVIGMICMRDPIQGLIGILAAFACAMAVQYIYVNADTFVIVDIIERSLRRDSGLHS